MLEGADKDSFLLSNTGRTPAEPVSLPDVPSTLGKLRQSTELITQRHPSSWLDAPVPSKQALQSQGAITITGPHPASRGPSWLIVNGKSASIVHLSPVLCLTDKYFLGKNLSKTDASRKCWLTFCYLVSRSTWGKK